MFSAGALLAAWERGASLPETDRAPSLIRLWDDTCDIDQLTVGQCDTLLFELRRRLFGDLLDAVAQCPGCADEVSLPIDLADIQPELLQAGDPLIVRTDGYSVVCRIPRNHDLTALGQRNESLSEVDILEHCLIEAKNRDGQPAHTDALPLTVVTSALDAMAAADPGAHVLLSISCVCGYEWTDQLDIRAAVWNDLHDWVTQLLHDVHRLASSYGWSERDILELSPWRRAWYQEASGW